MACVVVQGTCGWADQQYPPGVKKDASSRLIHFSKTWPSVEVNSSCYAIVSPTVTEQWCKNTPPRFTFHFKAFGLFCSRGCGAGNLPGAIRDLLPPGLASSSDTFVQINHLPAIALEKTWSLFHQSLAPVYRAGKLGVIVFQFHLSFLPSGANLEWVVECRRSLDPRFRMAAEFRCRRWYTDPLWRQKTHATLTQHGIAWIAADELEHETFQKDRDQRGLPPGAESTVLPIALEVTTPDFFYIRVHRRHGMEDRRLSESEIKGWVDRIQSVAPSLQGNIYFLWGTDHANVPQTNQAALGAGLPEDLRFDWKEALKSDPRSLRGMLAQAAERATCSTAAVSAAAQRESSERGQTKVAPRSVEDGGKRGIKRYFQQDTEGGEDENLA